MNTIINQNFLLFHFLILFIHGILIIYNDDRRIRLMESEDSIIMFAYCTKISHKSTDRSNFYGLKRSAAFLYPSCKYNNYITTLKREEHNRLIVDDSIRGLVLFSFGPFSSLKNWFVETFTGGWYVPPMPTGQKASVRMKQSGPLQSEEETVHFFKMIGIPPDSTFDEVGCAYENTLNTLPEDMREPLENLFNEYIRKQIIYAFEHMESYMDKGPEAWREFWNPKKDMFGKVIEGSELRNEFEDEQLILSRLPPEFKVDKFREYWDKNSSRFRRIINDIDFPSLLRFSKNVKGRFLKCLTTMVPVMVLGCIPNFSSLSIAIESLLASKFIYGGDNERITNFDEYKSHDLHPSRTNKRSTSIKTLITLLVIFFHSSLGIGVSTLLQLYTNIANSISPQILNTVCVNSQLLLASILYDSSDMSTLDQIKRGEELISPLKDVVNATIE